MKRSFIRIFLFCIFALPCFAQNECNAYANPNVVVQQSTRDAVGVIHQVTCIDNLTGRLFHPGTSTNSSAGTGIVNASSFPGNDCGARILAADNYLNTLGPSFSGEIQVDRSCPFPLTTGLSLTPGHTIRFMQGGINQPYIFNALICLDSNDRWLAPPDAVFQLGANVNTPILVTCNWQPSQQINTGSRNASNLVTITTVNNLPSTFVNNVSVIISDCTSAGITPFSGTFGPITVTGAKTFTYTQQSQFALGADTCAGGSATYSLAAIVPPATPSLSASTTGGSLSTITVFVKTVINTTANGGHTWASVENSQATGGGCAGTPTCSVTVTAPALGTGQTYSVYDSTTTNAELREISCTEITTNCIIQTIATGPSPVPIWNTSLSTFSPHDVIIDGGIFDGNGFAQATDTPALALQECVRCVVRNVQVKAIAGNFGCKATTNIQYGCLDFLATQESIVEDSLIDNPWLIGLTFRNTWRSKSQNVTSLCSLALCGSSPVDDTGGLYSIHTNLTVDNGAAAGISLNSQFSEVIGGIFQNTRAATGIILGHDNGFQCNGCKVIGATVRNNVGQGIGCLGTNTSDVEIIGNEIDGQTVSGTAGIALAGNGCIRAHVIGNSVRNNYYGIRAVSSTGGQIIGNTVTLSQAGGIRLEGSTHFAISGNTVNDNGQGGAGVGQQHGISLDASSTLNTIGNNLSFDTTSKQNVGLFLGSSNNTILINDLTGSPTPCTGCIASGTTLISPLASAGLEDIVSFGKSDTSFSRMRLRIGGNRSDWYCDLSSGATAQRCTISAWTGGGYTELFRFGGTAPVAGAYVLSAGWGTTASVGSVTGFDSDSGFTITSSGTGQAANPTITFTFANGTFTNAPGCIAVQVAGTGAIADLTNTTESATAPVFTWNGTPVSGSTYRITIKCGGR